jgi:hypothetical protein
LTASSCAVNTGTYGLIKQRSWSSASSWFACFRCGRRRQRARTLSLLSHLFTRGIGRFLLCCCSHGLFANQCALVE